MNQELSNYYSKKIEREGQRYRDAKKAWLNGMSLSRIDAVYHFPRTCISQIAKVRRIYHQKEWAEIYL